MKLSEVRHRRLHNHGLVGAPAASIADVLGRYGALQAQEYAEAKWSLGQRAATVDAAASAAGATVRSPEGPPPTSAAVQRAYDAGAILRTHALRPTWHFLLPSDLRWIQALTGPRVHVQNGSVYRANELDASVQARARDALEAALSGGVALTRQEIAGVLARHGIEAAGQRLAYIVMHAELEAVVCSGPSKGKQRTYALVHERAPRVPPLDRDEALAELMRRYFRAHGPATVKDFTWWSSLTVADAKRGLDIVETELSRSDDGGRVYWFAEDGRPDATDTGTAHLIQGYDEYVVAYRESRDVFHSARSAAFEQRPPFTHAIVLDGTLIGHWRFVRGTGGHAIELQPYETLRGRTRRAVDAATARLEAFLGHPLETRL